MLRRIAKLRQSEMFQCGDGVWLTVVALKLKLKLKINLYSAIKSENSEALDGRSSQLSSQREYGEIKMF